jgi:hypothetical protein
LRAGSNSASFTIHASVEANVPTEVEFFVDVVEICADFLPRGIELAEFSVPPEVVARKLIHWPGRIGASPRVTIPVPDAARTAPGLEHLNGHAHAAQAVKEIETGESRVDDDDVEVFVPTVARPFGFGGAHLVPTPSPDQHAAFAPPTFRAWRAMDEAGADPRKTNA